jgi:hypothetical protein
MNSIFQVVPGNGYMGNNTPCFYSLDEAMKYGDEILLAGWESKYVNIFEWYIGAVRYNVSWGKVVGGEWVKSEPSFTLGEIISK